MHVRSSPVLLRLAYTEGVVTYSHFPPPVVPEPVPPKGPRRWPWVVGSAMVLAIVAGAMIIGGLATSGNSPQVEAADETNGEPRETEAPSTEVTTTTEEPTPSSEVRNTEAPQNETLEAYVQIEVLSGIACEDFVESSISGDVAHSQAPIKDGSGNVLGAGELDGGYDTEDSCVFESKFEIQVSEDGLYSVTFGTDREPFILNEDDDVRNGQLEAFLIVNDMDADREQDVPDEYPVDEIPDEDLATSQDSASVDPDDNCVDADEVVDVFNAEVGSVLPSSQIGGIQQDCVEGYALVEVYPGQDSFVDGATIYMSRNGGDAWHVLDYGTGASCFDWFPAAFCDEMGAY